VDELDPGRALEHLDAQMLRVPMPADP